MLRMIDRVADTDQELERNRRCITAMHDLRKLGVSNMTMVYYCWEAYESDWPCKTVIYLAAGTKPKTALIDGDTVTVMDGWEGP